MALWPCGLVVSIACYNPVSVAVVTVSHALPAACDEMLAGTAVTHGHVTPVNVHMSVLRYTKGMQRSRSFSRKLGTEDYASQNLGIHEDSLGNVFVKDLAVIPVSTPEVGCMACVVSYQVHLAA